MKELYEKVILRFTYGSVFVSLKSTKHLLVQIDIRMKNSSPYAR